MPVCNVMDTPTSVVVLYYEKFTVRLLMRKSQMSPGSPGCASDTKWTKLVFHRLEEGEPWG